MPGGKTWSKPYWYNILCHLPKFKTDFLEKQFAQLESASETEQNGMYIIAIAQVIQKILGVPKK